MIRFQTVRPDQRPSPLRRTRLRAGCRPFAIVLAACLSALPLEALSGDELAEIVSSCHFSNAEFGVQMIERCITDNKAVREQVLRTPVEHEAIVNRCRASSERGWDWVKKCVDADIDAKSALQKYPKEQTTDILRCHAEFGSSAYARVKKCVDKSGKAGVPAK